MTVLAAQLKRGGVLFPLPSSRGVSSDAIAVQGMITDAVEDLAASIALGDAVQTGIWQLALLQVKASRPNWDGYGARPINNQAVVRAISFLKTLPTTVPVPDLGVDPDGEVDCMWNLSPSRTFSVSIGPTGKLTYSALIGDAESFGTEWLSNEIPEAILRNLSRLLNS